MRPIFMSRRIPPILVLLFGLAVAKVAMGQSSGTIRRNDGATVSGIVIDSLSRQPLAGAVVQLVEAKGLARSARTEYSDWLGRFSFSNVPNGRYTIGFFHPILDSLGVEAPVREVVVAGHDAVTADMATPSPAQLRSVVCGTSDSVAIIVGVVRDAANGAPLEAARVTGRWFEVSFTRNDIRPHAVRLTARTGQNGWFALCNVPPAGTLSLIATHGADSTDQIEVEIPANGIVRREFYIGAATREGAAGATASADAPISPQARAGGAGLSGTVVSADEGKVVVGAEISVSRRFSTRTNESGQWALSEVPAGTRMLEVRAVGYSPVRRTVDVAMGAAPVRVALSTLSATLEAVRVSANARLHAADIAGFQERRRTGAGHYLTAADIDRRGDLFTSDIFRSIPGIQLGDPVDTLPPDKVTMDSPRTINKLILMRGNSGQWCVPGIHLDGAYYPGISAGDLNTLITTKEVAGIEVYSPASVPAQFQQTMTGCGSVLIWRK